MGNPAMQKDAGLMDLGARHTPKEAAEQLGFSPSTLAAWRGREEGPAYHKMGGRVFYYENDLREFIRKAKRS